MSLPHSFCVGLLVSLLAAPAVHARSQDEDAVRGVVHSYASGENSQESSVLAPLLSDHFRLVAILPNGQLTSVAREPFLQGIDAKRFGGNEVAVTIESVQVFRETAAVRAVFEGAAFYHHFMSLVKVDGRWQVAGSTLTLESPKE